MKAMAFLFLLAPIASPAQQKETFDLANFTISNNWKKTSGTSEAISYATTNNQKGTYCQIGIYRSTVSKGNLQADFQSEWQELIVKTYKPTAPPTMLQSGSDDGWDVQGGAAPFAFNGGQSMAMLVTMSGYSRCMSVVILTNTQDYQSEIEAFLSSVHLIKPENALQTMHSTPNAGGFAFTTTNFDDGWTSTVREDWIQVTKGNFTVLVHYPNKAADEYNSVLKDGLYKAWSTLVAPRYNSIVNFELKPISGWQSLEFADADAIEKTTGKRVHLVLFKYNYSNGSGKYLEFITPDRNSFEQEFGAYHESTSGWEKMEKMASYNKFAVAVTDLQGTWTNDFSGALQYVNAYTGADAGMAVQASNERFEFGPGGTYYWDIGVASGKVGDIKFQSAKSSGIFTVPTNWQVNFSDIEGKPRTYNASFSCIKGARILWLGDTGYGRVK